MPLFWSWKDLLSLSGTSTTWESVMHQRRALLAEYQILTLKCKEFVKIYTFQDWCWSRGIIMTRAFRVTFDFGTISTKKTKAKKSTRTSEQENTIQRLQLQTFIHPHPFGSHLLGGEKGPNYSTDSQKTCKNHVLGK